MIEKSVQPLTQQVAGLSAAIHAEVAQRAAQDGLAATLHALIFAALARIIDRLAAMLALWQSGQLPPQSPPRAPRPVREHTPAPLRAVAASRPRRPRARIVLACVKPRGIRPVGAKQPCAHSMPRAVPMPPRAWLIPQPRPPPGWRFCVYFEPARSCAQNVTISF